jgi:hypothetical protein
MQIGQKHRPATQESKCFIFTYSGKDAREIMIYRFVTMAYEVSETVFCIHLQVEPSQVSSID